MIHSIQQEFIEKVYWENPDDPDDNGYAYVCNRCGEHGQTKEWADHHACDTEYLQEKRYWEDFYAPNGVCTRCGVADKFSKEELADKETLCCECYDIVHPPTMN